jgi:hypothetical protein
LVYLVSGVGLGKELWLVEFGRIDGNLEHEAAAFMPSSKRACCTVTGTAPMAR